MSSCRVMAACAILVQAAGTAASIAIERKLAPRGVYQEAIRELQERLMENDCWLPFHSRTVSALTQEAVLLSDSADAENLRNGADRPADGTDNGAYLTLGQPVTYRIPKCVRIQQVRLVLDSDLERESCDGDKRMRTSPML